MRQGQWDHLQNRTNRRRSATRGGRQGWHKVDHSLQDLKCSILMFDQTRPMEQTDANNMIPTEEVMSALIRHTSKRYSRRDIAERHRMRRLLNATSSQVNAYQHQGSHIWRSKPFKGVEQIQSHVQNQIQAKRKDAEETNQDRWCKVKELKEKQRMTHDSAVVLHLCVISHLKQHSQNLRTQQSAR